MSKKQVHVWESLVQLDRLPAEYIERDFAGTGGYLRYTHVPSGKTLVQQPYYRHEGKLAKWIHDRDEFLAGYPADMPIITSSLKLLGLVGQARGYQDFER